MEKVCRGCDKKVKVKVYDSNERRSVYYCNRECRRKARERVRNGEIKTVEEEIKSNKKQKYGKIKKKNKINKERDLEYKKWLILHKLGTRGKTNGTAY